MALAPPLVQNLEITNVGTARLVRSMLAPAKAPWFESKGQYPQIPAYNNLPINLDMNTPKCPILRSFQLFESVFLVFHGQP